jgi:hypothetical protein
MRTDARAARAIGANAMSICRKREKSMLTEAKTRRPPTRNGRIRLRLERAMAKPALNPAARIIRAPSHTCGAAAALASDGGESRNAP